MNGDSTIREIVLPMDRVYRLAWILLPVILLLYSIPYLIVWFRPFTADLLYFFGSDARGLRFMILKPYLVWGSLAFLVSIPVHELLHGLGWMIFTGKGLRSLRFGFMKTEMAPYAHWNEPLKVNAYRAGILLPALVLGVLPAFFGIMTGRAGWLIFGIVLTWAASGDLIMFWVIRKLKTGTWVRDHPEKLGCIIVKNDPIA